MKKRNFVFLAKVMTVVFVISMVTVLGVFAAKVFAQPEGAAVVSAAAAGAAPAAASKNMTWGFLSAAISVGLGSIAGGIAVAYVGSAALGAIGEKPELAARALLFVGLAEGIAIYGLIIAIMILGRI